MSGRVDCRWAHNCQAIKQSKLNVWITAHTRSLYTQWKLTKLEPLSRHWRPVKYLMTCIYMRILVRSRTFIRMLAVVSVFPLLKNYCGSVKQKWHIPLLRSSKPICFHSIHRSILVRFICFFTASQSTVGSNRMRAYCVCVRACVSRIELSVIVN